MASRQGYNINLVIIIENGHLIREKNNVENNFKYWIPKILPERVKLLVTMPITSYNLPYFKSIDAKMFKIKCP